jgi:4a-hydroxytetrahydrobiopterin dehydratase
MKKLSPDDVAERLALLPAWTLDGDRLYRDFRFSSFARAFGFMATAALVCERMDHHPEWLNSYDRLQVWLSTHDAGGITERDFALAAAMDKLPVG